MTSDNQARRAKPAPKNMQQHHSTAALILNRKSL